MGSSTARLLVAVFFIALTGAASAKDNALIKNHREFWLWPGVTMPAGLTIDRLYVLTQSLNPQGKFIQYRQTPPRLKKIGEVMLVYRLESLPDTEAIVDHAARDIAAWEITGNHVRGIQIDFDSNTSALDNYATFLAQLRQKLDKRFILSVTGLMDWGNAKQYDMQTLSATVDEIVFQTYQNRTTLPDYPRYLAKIATLKIPFKIGVISGGELSMESHQQLTANKNFQGYVMFLLNTQ